MDLSKWILTGGYPMPKDLHDLLFQQAMHVAFKDVPVAGFDDLLATCQQHQNRTSESSTLGHGVVDTVWRGT